MDGFSLIVLVIVGVLLSYSLSSFRRTADRNRQEEVNRSSRCINQRMNEYLDHGIRPINSEIRSKRNEYMFEEASFDLYRYKSTGRVAGHGFRYRMSIAKGLTYNAGVGQLHANKDWLKDDKALVTISNQAITCTSTTSSKRFTWTSLATLEVFANGFVLTPSRGTVLMFECEEPIKEHHSVLALLTMEQENSGTLASAHIRQGNDDNANEESQSSDSSNDNAINTNDFANEDRVNSFHKPSATNDVEDIPSGSQGTKSRSMSYEAMREKEKVARKLKKWAVNQNQINAQILNTFLKLKRYGSGRVTVSMMRNQLPNIKTFQSNFDQMKSISSKNHGKVFDVSGDQVTIWLFVEAEVLEYERIVFPDIDC
ncbi:type II secretion system protein [Vibrio gigantis]|uniref:type II secretion system protein n=1 Tax=Vibrio gigantis TaxID=296199 RepID=UPI002FC82FF1